MQEGRTCLMTAVPGVKLISSSASSSRIFSSCDRLTSSFTWFRNSSTCVTSAFWWSRTKCLQPA